MENKWERWYEADCIRKVNTYWIVNPLLTHSCDTYLHTDPECVRMKKIFDFYWIGYQKLKWTNPFFFWINGVSGRCAEINIRV